MATFISEAKFSCSSERISDVEATERLAQAVAGLQRVPVVNIERYAVHAESGRNEPIARSCQRVVVLASQFVLRSYDYVIAQLRPIAAHIQKCNPASDAEENIVVLGA